MSACCPIQINHFSQIQIVFHTSTSLCMLLLMLKRQCLNKFWLLKSFLLDDITRAKGKIDNPWKLELVYFHTKKPCLQKFFLFSFVTLRKWTDVVGRIFYFPTNGNITCVVWQKTLTLSQSKKGSLPDPTLPQRLLRFSQVCCEQKKLLSRVKLGTIYSLGF